METNAKEVKLVAMDGDYVPIAGHNTPGIASFNENDFILTPEGFVSLRQRVGAIQYIGQIAEVPGIESLSFALEPFSPKKIMDFSVGDLVLDVNSGFVYECSGTVTYAGTTYVVCKDIAPKFSILGPEGKVGPEGPEGPQGEPGKDGIIVALMQGVYYLPNDPPPGGPKPGQLTLPSFEDTKAGEGYLVDDGEVEGQYDLYMHSVNATDWTVIDNWGGVPGPQGPIGASLRYLPIYSNKITKVFNGEDSFTDISLWSETQRSACSVVLSRGQSAKFYGAINNKTNDVFGGLVGQIFNGTVTTGNNFMLLRPDGFAKFVNGSFNWWTGAYITRPHWSEDFYKAVRKANISIEVELNTAGKLTYTLACVSEEYSYTVTYLIDDTYDKATIFIAYDACDCCSYVPLLLDNQQVYINNFNEKPNKGDSIFTYFEKAYLSTCKAESEDGELYTLSLPFAFDLPKGEKGNGITSVHTIGHVTQGNETVTTVQVSTDEEPYNFEVHAQNGAKGADGKDGENSSVAVTIYLPATATSGTLTEEQLTTLQAYDMNYIIFNNELYTLQDKQHDDAYLIYSHVGHNSTNDFMIKCITITVNTRDWVPTEQKVGAGGGESTYDLIISTQEEFYNFCQLSSLGELTAKTILLVGGNGSFNIPGEEGLVFYTEVHLFGIKDASISVTDLSKNIAILGDANVPTSIQDVIISVSTTHQYNERYYAIQGVKNIKNCEIICSAYSNNSITAISTAEIVENCKIICNSQRGNAYGIYYARQVENCKITCYTGSGQTITHGIDNSTNVMNCIVTLTSYGEIGYLNCINLVNCDAFGNKGYTYTAFKTCERLVNCNARLGSPDITVKQAYDSCSYLSNCKYEGIYTTAWAGTNTKRDDNSCTT